MKRILTLLLAVLMLLSFAACAGADKNDDNALGGTIPGTGNNGTNGSNGSNDGSNAGDGDSQLQEHTLEDFVRETLEMDLCGKSEYVKGSVPPEVWDWYESEHGLTYDSVLAAYEQHQAIVKENRQYEYGDNYQISFTIDEVRPILESFTLEQVADALAAAHTGVDASKVTDVHELTITLTQSGDKYSYTGTFGYSVVRYDGRWYAVVYERNDSGTWATFSSPAFR